MAVVQQDQHRVVSRQQEQKQGFFNSSATSYFDAEGSTTPSYRRNGVFRELRHLDRRRIPSFAGANRFPPGIYTEPACSNGAYRTRERGPFWKRKTSGAQAVTGDGSPRLVGRPASGAALLASVDTQGQVFGRSEAAKSASSFPHPSAYSSNGLTTASSSSITKDLLFLPHNGSQRRLSWGCGFSDQSTVASRRGSAGSSVCYSPLSPASCSTASSVGCGPLTASSRDLEPVGLLGQDGPPGLASLASTSLTGDSNSQSRTSPSEVLSEESRLLAIVNSGEAVSLSSPLILKKPLLQWGSPLECCGTPAKDVRPLALPQIQRSQTRGIAGDPTTATTGCRGLAFSESPASLVSPVSVSSTNSAGSYAGRVPGASIQRTSSSLILADAASRSASSRVPAKQRPPLLGQGGGHPVFYGVIDSQFEQLCRGIAPVNSESGSCAVFQKNEIGVSGGGKVVGTLPQSLEHQSSSELSSGKGGGCWSPSGGTSQATDGCGAGKKRNRVIFCRVCNQFKPRSTRARFQSCDHIACYDCVRVALHVEFWAVKLNLAHRTSRAVCPVCRKPLDWSSIKPYIVLSEEAKYSPVLSLAFAGKDIPPNTPCHSREGGAAAMGCDKRSRKPYEGDRETDGEACFGVVLTSPGVPPLVRAESEASEHQSTHEENNTRVVGLYERRCSSRKGADAMGGNFRSFKAGALKSVSELQEPIADGQKEDETEAAWNRFKKAQRIVAAFFPDGVDSVLLVSDVDVSRREPGPCAVQLLGFAPLPPRRYSKATELDHAEDGGVQRENTWSGDTSCLVFYSDPLEFWRREVVRDAYPRPASASLE